MGLCCGLNFLLDLVREVSFDLKIYIVDVIVDFVRVLSAQPISDFHFFPDDDHLRALLVALNLGFFNELL